MRLLDVSNLDDIRLVEFSGYIEVEYTILSHCWSHDEATKEVDYCAFSEKHYYSEGAGWKKILKCCELTKAAGYQYTWVDTCCIDKSSSAELSESINSMYKWYQNAAVCYVFMNACHAIHLPSLDGIDAEGQWRHGLHLNTALDVEEFVNDRWFKRGWTLQELVAPKSLIIYNSDYVELGTKLTLIAILSCASGIDACYLNGEKRLAQASIAQRMSWASERDTHRIEDVAYCLLGLFDVNLPLLYGEGKRAFLRLQEEILHRTEDHSILAWDIDNANRSSTGVLAEHPKYFRHCKLILKTSSGLSALLIYKAPCNLTSMGLPLRRKTLFPFDTAKAALNNIIGLGPPQIEHAVTLDCYDSGLAKDAPGFQGTAEEGEMQSRIQLMLYSAGSKWYRSRLRRQPSPAARFTLYPAFGWFYTFYTSTTTSEVDAVDDSVYKRAYETTHGVEATRDILIFFGYIALAIGVLAMITVVSTTSASHVLVLALVIIAWKAYGFVVIWFALVLGIALSARQGSECRPCSQRSTGENDDGHKIPCLSLCQLATMGTKIVLFGLRPAEGPAMLFGLHQQGSAVQASPASERRSGRMDNCSAASLLSHDPDSVRRSFRDNNTNMHDPNPITRTMRQALPADAKLSKQAKECMPECVGEFIPFITSEASENAQIKKGAGLFLVTTSFMRCRPSALRTIVRR